MQLQDLLSKPVLSLYDGTNEGFVLSVWLDEKLKKVKALIISNNDDNSPIDELLLHYNDILKIGKDAIVIKNNSLLETKNLNYNINYSYSPINNSAYTIDGEYLGKISDIEIDDKFNVLHFIIGQKQIPANMLATFSNGTIIFNTETKKIKLQNLKPAIKNLQNISTLNNTVTILDKFNEDKLKENETLKTITRLSTNNNLLIGKSVTKNITSENGEIIARKNSIINAKTIILATAHQKIRELALNSASLPTPKA